MIKKIIAVKKLVDTQSVTWGHRKDTKRSQGPLTCSAAIFQRKVFTGSTLS